jgi:hypothetical protein
VALRAHLPLGGRDPDRGSLWASLCSRRRRARARGCVLIAVLVVVSACGQSKTALQVGDWRTASTSFLAGAVQQGRCLLVTDVRTHVRRVICRRLNASYETVLTCWAPPSNVSDKTVATRLKLGRGLSTADPSCESAATVATASGLLVAP